MLNRSPQSCVRLSDKGSRRFRGVKLPLFWLGLLCSPLMALPAMAQDKPTEAEPESTSAESSRVQSFAPDFFKSFQVTSALDMIFHIPGFSFNGGDTSVRGYAGAAGNVLINGQRPASKDEDLDSILSRIPASQVERIDLIIGGAPGIDMQGQTRVVNVIRKETGKPSLTLDISNQFWRKGLSRPYFGVTYSSSKDGKRTEFSYERAYFIDDGNNDGNRTTRFEATGVTVPMDIYQEAIGDLDGFKGRHERPFMGGQLNLNLNYRPIREIYNARFIDTDTATEHYEYLERAYEASAQYTKTLGKRTKLETNLLLRHATERFDDRYTEPSVAARYFEDTASDENILTARLSFQRRENQSLQVSVERTFNGRDTASLYTEGTQSQNIPASVVTVQEDRTEYAALGNWRVHPKLTLEAGVRVETSEIGVKQGNREASFVYPKPKFLVVYSPISNMKLTWRVERKVSQLNFGDFAAGVDLQSTNVRAGNTELVPTKFWANNLSAEYTFWKKGSLTLTYEHQALEDVVDNKPLISGTDTFDARGNIGDGKLDKINVDLTLPLEAVLKGAELKANMQVRESEVTDPLTHLKRPISGLRHYELEMHFVQSLPKRHLKWGVNYSRRSANTQYSTYQITRFTMEPWVGAFVEFKFPKNLSLTLEVQNLINHTQTFERLVYNGVRSQNNLSFYERTQSWPHPYGILSLHKEF